MDDADNIATSFDVFPIREYKVRFIGGPYDGREGTLPFLPTFICLHNMDGDWGAKDGKLVIDTRLSEYVYMLNVCDDDDSTPSDYILRPRVDVADWFRH